jgi:hypothetical protein
MRSGSDILISFGIATLLVAAPNNETAGGRAAISWRVTLDEEFRGVKWSESQ